MQENESGVLTTLRAVVSDLRPSHTELQLGARMRRHADSTSEWNNLFTNLSDTGRLELTEEVDEALWGTEDPLPRTDLHGIPAPCVYVFLFTVVLMWRHL